jgi:hypothetical protein
MPLSVSDKGVSMIRTLLLGSLFLIGLGAVACQSYTTTLVESPGRVDEQVALSTLRTIASAQTMYSLSNSGAYGSFEQLVVAGHLDSRFSPSPPKVGGYILTMTVSGGAESSYHCNADPDAAANRKGRHFYLGSAAPEIRANLTRVATANDEVVQP